MQLEYRRGGPARWLDGPPGRWVALCATVALLGTAAALGRPALPDLAWPLYLAARVLDGARLAVDYVEVNPPLFVWLAIPPVLVERGTGLPAYPAALGLLLVLLVASVAVSNRLLVRLPGLPDPARRWLMVAALFALFVLPRRDFTEREHLALALTLPWMCLAVLRASGKRVRAGAASAIGLAGAIGFALKPYFLPAWLLVEALLIARRGWRSLVRPESIVLLGAGAVYLVAVLVLVPDYLPVALAFRPLYDLYLDNGIIKTVLLGLGGPLPLFALTAAAAHWQQDRRPDPVRAVFTAATLGFLVAAVVQQKGWRYHYVAAMGYGLVLLALVAVRSAGALRWTPSGLITRLAWLVLPAAAIGTSASTVVELVDPNAPRYREDPNLDLLAPVVRREAAGEPIMVFSSNPASGWPLTVDAGARWASRYMSLWPLAAIYYREIWWSDAPVVFRPLAGRAGLERDFHEAVVEDLERYDPRLLVVLEPSTRVWGWGGAARLDYLGYFGEDPRFQRFFARYRDIGRVGMYRLYRRS